MMTKIKEFFDPATFTLTYVVWNGPTLDAVVIDSVLDYDPASSKITETSAQQVIEFIRHQKLKLHYILETHAHADHVSGAQVIKREIPGAKIAIGARICEVQKIFGEVFDLTSVIGSDGHQFDELFKDNEIVGAGALQFKVLYTPGHTPACVSYLIGDAVFTGDALFMPDSGTGRCDFPAGSAAELYNSIHERLYKLPSETRVYTGHDYQPNGRELKFCSTIAEEKQNNIQLKEGTTQSDYVKFRTERDKTLTAPRLLLPSVQLNINAGKLPPLSANGRRYLKIPVGTD